MNAPRILYRHPEARGVIVADPAHHRLIVSSADEESTVAVVIGPRCMRNLAAELVKVADAIEGGAQ
jgi:hypothetical protein